MELRSRKREDSKASNIIRVKVDKYEYWFDILDLKVYDEKDNEYTIKEILEKPFFTEEKILSVYNELNKRITATANSVNNTKNEMERLVSLLSETVRALNNKVAMLENEISIINNKIKYM